ncbi:MAG: hypothetical protein ACRBF0_16430 [Calditrichia bacterium]
MKKIVVYRICIVLLTVCLVGCGGQEPSVRTIELPKKDLIPEGTAFNETTNSIYVGSIYRQKIIEITIDGEVRDLLGQDLFGELSPVGIEFDDSNHTLWINMALSPVVNQTLAEEWKTGLMAYDIKKKVSWHYLLEDSLPSFFNDLTVLPNGDVIITETANARLFRFDATIQKLQLYANLEETNFPNGITYHEPSRNLFVSTNQGIVKIDMVSKEQTLLNVADGINATVIDGLSLHENYFIGHQSSKITRFYVDKSFTTLTESDVFDSGPEFDSSTTGEVGDGFYHYIVNSQIRSGVENKRIKPLDSLETILIRSKLLASDKK